MKIKNIFLFLVFAMIFFQSCKDKFIEEVSTIQPISYEDSITQDLEILSKYFDVPIRSIEIDDQKYIIDGDVSVYKKYVKGYENFMDSNRATSRAHRRAGGYPESLNGSTVTIYLHPTLNFDTRERNAFNRAVNILRSAPCFGLRFRIVRNANADITFRRRAFDTCAEGDWPYMDEQNQWHFGPEVTVHFNNLSETQLARLYTHEIMHNLGFNHPNINAGTHIPFSLTNDSRSVMLPCNGCGPCRPRDLSEGDKYNLSSVYPSSCVYQSDHF